MEGMVWITMGCLYWVDHAGTWAAWMRCAASAWRTQTGGAPAISRTSIWQGMFSRPLVGHLFVWSSCTGLQETHLPIKITKTSSWR